MSSTRREDEDPLISYTDLPTEIQSFIPSHESKKVEINLMGALSNSCNTLHTFFQPDLTKFKEMLTILMTAILTGKDTAALNIIARYPAFLFIKTSAYDCVLADDGSRRKIHGSPFQAMLGAGNIGMLDKVNPFILALPDGCNMAAAQFKEQFPNGCLPETSLKNYDFTALIIAIANEQFIDGHLNETTQAELKKFRDFYAPTDVSSGKHFNLHILKMVFKIYVDCHADWIITDKMITGNWNDRKPKLFLNLVYGYLQRMISAVDAQAFCQGLYYIVKGKPLEESLLLPSGLPFYPAGVSPCSGLGFDFAVSVLSQNYLPLTPVRQFSILESYITQKESLLLMWNFIYDDPGSLLTLRK